MPKVHFYLQTPKREASYLRLTFNYSGGRLVYYPGERIKTAHWNATAERVRKTAPGWAELNAGLDRLDGLVLDIWRKYRNDGRPLPPDLFRQELDAAWKGRISPTIERITLFGFWGQLIEERRVSPNYAANSLKAYTTALHKLQAFAASTRRRVDFDGCIC